MKRNPSAVHSLTILSLIANVYIICLASAAIDRWKNLIDGENNLFSTKDRHISGPLEFALITDLLCFIGWFILALVSIFFKCCSKKDRKCEVNCTCGSVKKWGICHCQKCTPDQPDKCKHCTDCTKCCHDLYMPFLSLTILCPVFCVIVHSPFIAIAYLDDGSHASSMFIYYSILGYVLFGLLWLFFHWCENFENDITNDCCDCKVNCLCGCTLIMLFFVIFIFLGLVVTISCYFVLIPINKSISDAPNRVVSIYQSGGFIIGSVIVYKILEFFYIKKKKDTDTAKDTYEILQKRLPLPYKQQFDKLQQQYNQLQLELLLTLQSPESQDQFRDHQKKFLKQRLENLQQIEQQLLQEQQQQPRQAQSDQQQNEPPVKRQPEEEGKSEEQPAREDELELQELPSREVEVELQEPSAREEVEAQKQSGEQQQNDGKKSQTLDDLQQKVHDLQNKCYKILFPQLQSQEASNDQPKAVETNPETTC